MHIIIDEQDKGRFFSSCILENVINQKKKMKEIIFFFCEILEKKCQF